MARSFHRKRSLEPNSELNVTALIDLGFALLIIFMISTPLIEKEQVMEVDLPVSGQSSEKAQPKSVDITVLKDGYRVDGNLMGEPELERELAGFATMSKAPVISIRGDAETPYQRIMNLMDLLKEYELGKIHFVTKEKE
ncbi:biopolymer transporter ExbD [Pelagicoccus sp. NFK12]|uniref:Biopolymer transporter ExbD n=1 Tax=Pelagicoccus enzymogenes TaxID=2773457 RepID=A0A927F8G8_9BACT|nr:biopolymer transporter ExbD [Pelagicoccus enzymogenes]MBD5780264.1 biopolymer transporter ExbD [Pelagicoccus enzymogenes]MDQ8200874.1 biopolymer transporter ExbD [Pelagicoccus enzymogenes]